VFGPAGLQQRTVGAASQYAGGDGLGSVRLITDGAGNAAGAAGYEAWGAPKAGSATLGGFGFTGEQADAETGFVYLRARHYDPATGRFVQQDGYLGQTSRPQSLNLFAYVQGNPVKMVDPSGHAEALGGGNLNNTRQECIAAGYLADFCALASPEELAAVMADTGGTLIDPTDPIDVIRNGSPADWVVCGATLLGTDGLSALANIGARATVRGIFKTLDKVGISYTKHAAEMILGRGPRGITEQTVLDTYRNGRLYHDPKSGNYISRASAQ
jgi:RHS repeat-associated protein